MNAAAREVVLSNQPRSPGDGRADRHRDQSAGNAAFEAHAAEVHHQDDRQRRQPDDRVGEGLKEEAQRDERQASGARVSRSRVALDAHGRDPVHRSLDASA